MVLSIKFRIIMDIIKYYITTSRLEKREKLPIFKKIINTNISVYIFKTAQHFQGIKFLNRYLKIYLQGSKLLLHHNKYCVYRLMQKIKTVVNVNKKRSCAMRYGMTSSAKRFSLGGKLDFDQDSSISGFCSYCILKTN